MNPVFHSTDLDALKWFRAIEGMTLDEMRGRLLRTEPANDAMLRGTTWHNILENPPDEISMVMLDGFKFRVECDAEVSLPQIREIRARKDYEIDGVTVTITGKVDGISGTKITDHKLTFSENIETYCDSYQWRAYLDIFNADTFEYILYAAKEKDGEIVIHNISSFKVYRYPGMKEDLEEGIRDLLVFCKEYVPEMLTK